MGQFVRRMSIALLKYAYSEVENSKLKNLRRELHANLVASVPTIKAEIVPSIRGTRYW